MGKGAWMMALVVPAQPAEGDLLPGATGLTIGLLADCGVKPPSPDLDAEGRTEWLCYALDTLRRRDMAIAALRGVLLRVALLYRSWEGRAGSWAEFVAQYAGLDKYEASRLMTIADVLLRRAGIDADDVTAVGDTTKLHHVAAGVRKALDEARSEEEQQVVLDNARKIVADAAHMSRSDVRAAMGEVHLAPEDCCFEPVHQRLCARTGAVGDVACDLCRPVDKVAR